MQANDRVIHALLPARAAPGRATQLAAAAGATIFLGLAVAGQPATAAIGLLTVASAVIAFHRPTLLGPLVALLLPAGPWLYTHGRVFPLAAGVGGGALGYLARIATTREELRFGAAHWTYAGFFVLVALSNLGHGSFKIDELLFFGALGFVFHAITSHLGTAHDRRLLLTALTLATLFEASWALFQYVDRWPDRISKLGGALVFPLPTGTLQHANALGQFLVLAGFAVLALALAETSVVRHCAFFAVGASGLALLATLSRASWIALAAGASVFLLHRRSRRPVAAAGVAATAAVSLAVLLGGAIGERISSIVTAPKSGFTSFRFELAETSARIVADHPLTGSGHFEEVGLYNTLPVHAGHPHNLFLGLAVFFGVPAALAFAALVSLAVRAAWRGFRTRADNERLMAVGFLAFLGALLVNGLFEYPFWNPTLSALVVVGLAAAVTLDSPVSRESGDGTGVIARAIPDP